MDDVIEMYKEKYKNNDTKFDKRKKHLTKCIEKVLDNQEKEKEKEPKKKKKSKERDESREVSPKACDKSKISKSKIKLEEEEKIPSKKDRIKKNNEKASDMKIPDTVSEENEESNIIIRLKEIAKFSKKFISSDLISDHQFFNKLRRLVNSYKTSLEVDNAFRNVCNEKINNISLQNGEGEIVVKKDKVDQILIEYINSARVKENINYKIKITENVDDCSIVTYLSKERNLDVDETLSFFLSLCNQLKISKKIKDGDLMKKKQVIHPKVMKRIDLMKKIEKILSKNDVEMYEKGGFWYLKGELAYHYKVNLILISYLTKLLNTKLCDPYYQPYYSFESKNTLIKLNYIDNEDEIKKFMCSNKNFFDKHKAKIKNGDLRIYRVQNPLISYQFHALQWSFTLEKNDEWIEGARIRHYSLQLFDQKKDAEELCKIIDMHVLKLISFIDLDLVLNVKSDEFVRKLKPCSILFDAIVIKSKGEESIHGVMPKYAIINKKSK